MRWDGIRERRSVGVFVLAAALATVAAACGSSQGGSTFGNQDPDASAGQPGSGSPGGSGDFDLDAGAGTPDPDAFFVNDPPPRWCGPDGGATTVPTPGGTPECPDDKNRQGCSCPQEGMTAPCWPGARAQRGLGVCKDGVTTCVKNGEVSKTWGPCVGAVYPAPGATKGREACKCFSQGLWQIDNVIPFLVELRDSNNQITDQYCESSLVTSVDDAGVSQVRGRTRMQGNQIVQDHGNFSKDRLNVDCEGRFDLCFVIKVGDYKNPKASDCAIMNPVCTGEFDYPKKGVVKELPQLVEWMSATPDQKACAREFKTKRGYAELSVKGQSYLCEPIDDGAGSRYVFQRFQYCPLTCNQTPNAPECQGCTNGASGQF